MRKKWEPLPRGKVYFHCSSFLNFNILLVYKEWLVHIVWSSGWGYAEKNYCWWLLATQLGKWIVSKQWVTNCKGPHIYDKRCQRRIYKKSDQPKHVMWQRVFWGASEFKVRSLSIVNGSFICVGSLAGVTYLRYTELTSSKKSETAVHCCFIGSCHVGVSKRFSQSISLAVYCLTVTILMPPTWGFNPKVKLKLKTTGIVRNSEKRNGKRVHEEM